MGLESKNGIAEGGIGRVERRGRGRAPKVMWKPAIRMQSESYVEIRGATTLSLSLSIIKRKRRRNNLREKVRSCKVYWRQVGEEIGAGAVPDFALLRLN